MGPASATAGVGVASSGVAAVSPTDQVTLLDPARMTKGRTVGLKASAAIDNIVAWVDTPTI